MRKINPKKYMVLAILTTILLMSVIIIMISIKMRNTESEVGKLTGKVLNKNSNTEIFDKYGNKIVVPAGFMIRVDATTNHADDVTEGIVVEDTEGNQFVWIPIGKIYTSVDKKEYETIELGRYLFNSDGCISEKLLATEPNEKLYETSTSDDYYTEALKNEETNNMQAKDIENFIKSVKINGGYYIGRYEAGITGYDSKNIETKYNREGIIWTGYKAVQGKELKLVCKSNEQIWNYVTQGKAAQLSQTMYDNDNFSSDLINSFAWDTAIVFIQTFGNCKNYSNENFCSSLTVTGGNKDEYCNINDMSGNASEWSTESYNSTIQPCVRRGGFFNTDLDSDYEYSSTRDNSSTTYFGGDSYSFRPILYLGL